MFDFTSVLLISIIYKINSFLDSSCQKLNTYGYKDYIFEIVAAVKAKVELQFLIYFYKHVYFSK